MRIIGGGLLAGLVLLAGAVGQEVKASTINTAKPESTKVTWKEGAFSHKPSRETRQNPKLTSIRGGSFTMQNFQASKGEVEERWEAEKVVAAKIVEFEKERVAAKDTDFEKDKVAAEKTKSEEEKIASNKEKESEKGTS